MPRFFFHITDGQRTFTDAYGVQFKSITDVRTHLVSYIRELRSALSESGVHDWSHWSVIVSDEKNRAPQAIDLGRKPQT